MQGYLQQIIIVVESAADYLEHYDTKQMTVDEMKLIMAGEIEDLKLIVTMLKHLESELYGPSK